MKQKVNKEKNELSGYKLKIKNNKKLLNDLQEEINKVKKENFEKKEVIINLQKEIKQDKTKIDEYEKKINIYISEKSDLTKENVELRNKNSELEKNYKNRINVLEKQLKNLSEANNNFVQENNDVQTQLKDFQIYTNMAKVNTKKLNKKDFSILEVMSKRAETAESESQKLLTYIDELKSLNEQIKNKIKPLEDYALLQIKHDHEIRLSNDSLLDIQNKIFTDEERKEIDKLKNKPNELFQTLIKLKTENLELHKHIKDITVECNQQLREARWKSK
jgi:chromosome segregation ATPase